MVRVVLTAPPADPGWQGWYEDVKQGWITFVQQLRFALERHPGEERVSVLLSGVPKDGRSIVELPGAGTGLPEEVTGTPWFRSEHQLGVTVDQWGDGLLIGSDRLSPRRRTPRSSPRTGRDRPRAGAPGGAEHYLGSEA